MNWEKVSRYLELQSRFCKERAWAEKESAEIVQQMSMLSDIYGVLSHAILEGIGQAPQWPEPEEQSGSKLLLQEDRDEVPF